MVLQTRPLKNKQHAQMPTKPSSWLSPNLAAAAQETLLPEGPVATKMPKRKTTTTPRASKTTKLRD